MNKEILLMKQQRVKLMRRIKEESEEFRRRKLEQDKEVMQLRAKDRKRAVSTQNHYTVNIFMSAVTVVDSLAHYNYLLLAPGCTNPFRYKPTPCVTTLQPPLRGKSICFMHNQTVSHKLFNRRPIDSFSLFNP